MSASQGEEPAVIVEYNVRWPALFEEERARVASAVAALAVAIEHIGSTAVPGLCAKPIIDMLVTVERLEPAERYIPALAALGYVYRADPANTERHAFGRRDAQGRRPVPGNNLRVEQHGGAEHQRHIAFRDYLRAHPEAMREYCALKRALAAAYGADRDGYTEAKTAFIREIEARAGLSAPPG